MIGDAKLIISSPNAPAALGPYSQAVRAGDYIFMSGQIAIDAKTGEVVAGGATEQTEQILKNINAVLDVAGSSLFQVVKTTVFLKNMGDFAAMNEVYGKFFCIEPPARSTVEVARLPKDVLVEIECTVFSPRKEASFSGVGFGAQTGGTRI